MRAFILSTKPWSKGLEVTIFEDDAEVGTTQTIESSTEGAVLAMAGNYVELAYGLTDDEYTLTIRG